jgi:SAM-dependent methyltransferase
MSLGPVLRRVQDTLLSPEPAYRLWLRQTGAALPPRGELVVPGWCGTLKSVAQWQADVADSRRLGLSLHPDLPKNWDGRIAAAALLATTAEDDPILDAGAETYSRILSTLYAYGRRNLVGINLTFTRPAQRGPIRFEPGDITRTRFADASFAGVACQSVIEHGVDLPAYFKEMARILRPGGLLVSSTDYFPEPVDTRGQWAYGVPIKIFTREEILKMIAVAADVGFEPTHELDLECSERPVLWKQYDLRYTFTCFTLRRR